MRVDNYYSYGDLSDTDVVLRSRSEVLKWVVGRVKEAVLERWPGGRFGGDWDDRGGISQWRGSFEFDRLSDKFYFGVNYGGAWDASGNHYFVSVVSRYCFDEELSVSTRTGYVMPVGTLNRGEKWRCSWCGWNSHLEKCGCAESRQCVKGEGLIPCEEKLDSQESGLYLVPVNLYPEKHVLQAMDRFVKLKTGGVAEEKIEDKLFNKSRDWVL